MLPIRILVLLIAFWSPTLFAGEIFSCFLADGSVTFSETPCNNAVTTKKGAKIQNNATPWATTYDPGYFNGYGSIRLSQIVGEIFTCVTESGSVTFSETPCGYSKRSRRTQVAAIEEEAYATGYSPNWSR